MLEIIGAPFDLCGRRAGSSLGPAAVRLAGLQGALTALGLQVVDRGDAAMPSARQERGGLRHFAEAEAAYLQVRGRVAQAIAEGSVPIVIGGDHSLAIGSVSGALEHCGEDLAVVWVDAHADLNAPGTSPSGNLHGMPLALLLGEPAGVEGVAADQWRRLRSQVAEGHRLRPDRVGWVGLRDVDDGEAATIARLDGAFPTTMQDIDRHGIEAVATALDRWLRGNGARSVWLSFDVDVLDPILAPGTGTAVRGGLSYREGHLFAELIREALDAEDCPYRLVGLDLVEVNPLFDTNNETAKLAVEWIGSLFGKTILGRGRRGHLSESG